MPFPLDKAFVDACEVKLGAKLPVEYVQAMCSCNGGERIIEGEDWFLHPIADTSDRKRLARTCNDIIRETAFWSDWPGAPDGAITIANDGCGNHLILFRNGDAFDSTIYRWDHETGDVTPVVSSFDQLG